MIACISWNASPVTLAMVEGFGDDTAYPLCHGVMTLQNIYELCQWSDKNGRKIDVWDVPRYLAESKKHHLSGVHLPFWRDWKLADPAIFLVPEILHTCHKFFLIIFSPGVNN